MNGWMLMGLLALTVLWAKCPHAQLTHDQVPTISDCRVRKLCLQVTEYPIKVVQPVRVYFRYTITPEALVPSKGQEWCSQYLQIKTKCLTTRTNPSYKQHCCHIGHLVKFHPWLQVGPAAQWCQGFSGPSLCGEKMATMPPNTTSSSNSETEKQEGRDEGSS